MPSVLRIGLFLLLFAGCVDTAYSQQPVTVFKGRPSVKISEGGVERAPETLSTDTAANLECVISQIGDRFYWASRENTPLIAVEAGAFITYVSVTGNGYVRVVKPQFKGAASAMSRTEERFNYVEHVVVGLRSVTFYGTREP
jgi:hypothetical protein